MIIVDFGFFHVIEPEDTPENPLPPQWVVCYENEDGDDWYELRAGLTEWRPEDGKYLTAVYGAWAMVDADGIVTNVEYDPARLAPLDRRILGIDASYRDIEVGMRYRDGQLETP